MPIVIGPGITIGSGITITNVDLRAYLSPAGKAAYDAAATDAWYSVSATDYGNVKAALVGVSTVGYTDNDLLNAGTSFSQNFGATLNQTNATIPGGNYILGFASRGAGTGSMTFSPYYGITFKGAYVTLGSNQITMNSSAAPTYWLRKNPTLEVSTKYVAVGKPNSGATLSWGGTGTWGSGATGGGYSSNMTSWTDFNTNLPAQQWLLTTTKQW